MEMFVNIDHVETFWEVDFFTLLEYALNPLSKLNLNLMMS